MAYSDFDLRTVLDRFGLRTDENTDLFAGVPPAEPGESVRTWLARFGRIAVGVGSELARTVYLIGPMLAEAAVQAGDPVHVLPGVTLDVDRGLGLDGYCDYLITRSGEYYFVRGPLAAVVEAKREDLVAGLGQCAAGMVGIRLFNERDGTPVPAVYGCVTSGTNWRFLKLEGQTLFIDATEYHIREAGKILGILLAIARGSAAGGD
jgi:hypothetical protein